MGNGQERLPSRQRKMEARKTHYQMDLPFLLLTIVLVVVGVIMMFSASYARAYHEEGNSTYYFARQAVFAVAGMGIMLLVSQFYYQVWRRLSFFILGLSVVLLILVLLIGTSEGGAQRWLWLGFSFQPSEVAKFAVVVTFATLISGFKEKMETFQYGVLPFAGILLVFSVLLLLEPHLSATIIICGVGATMMFQGGTKLRWFGILGILAVIAFLILVSGGYASSRIDAWLHPENDPRGASYQTIQSLYAIGSGGLFGLGFGKSRQKYMYLPEEHNDYVFPVVCEELGFVGAFLIIVLFVLLIIRGYWIALHAKDRFGALLAGGLTTLLALQVFLNIGVVTNFLPPTGISLPFFSYGGTALLMQLAQMGIILNVSRCGTDNLL